MSKQLSICIYDGPSIHLSEVVDMELHLHHGDYVSMVIQTITINTGEARLTPTNALLLMQVYNMYVTNQGGLVGNG